MKKNIYFMLTVAIIISCLAGCVEKEEIKSTVFQADEIDIHEGDEIAPATENETISEENHTNLNAEILAIEEASLEIQDQLQSSSTQTDMNIISGQAYQLWDDELNSLWQRFSDSASENLKSTVLEEQRNWIKYKETEVKLAGAQYEGGSIQQLIENTKATELTRIRCYEVTEYLAQATGQNFDLEVPRIEELDFVDRQGTDDIYSELNIEETDRNNYTVTIGIYRLVTFEGKAIMQNDGTYEFEDNVLGVKGIIRVLDDSSGATFEITESDWALVNAGDVFEFPERR